MNPLRKIIQKTGFDLHRYRPKSNYWEYLKSLNINTVLDIGANIGQFARETRKNLPDCQIYSFEPLKECFDKLNINFKNDARFMAFNLALGRESSETEMNKSSYTPSSSLLTMAEEHKKLFPHTKRHTSEKIRMEALDRMSSRLKLEKELLIKIDVQGFEMEVLRGGKNILRQAKTIIIENSFVKLYEDGSTFDSVYEELKSLGFAYKGSVEQKINPGTGQVISEDSLFEKQEPSV